MRLLGVILPYDCKVRTVLLTCGKGIPLKVSFVFPFSNGVSIE